MIRTWRDAVGKLRRWLCVCVGWCWVRWYTFLWVPRVARSETWEHSDPPRPESPGNQQAPTFNTKPPWVHDRILCVYVRVLPGAVFNWLAITGVTNTETPEPCGGPQSADPCMSGTGPPTHINLCLCMCLLQRVSVGSPCPDFTLCLYKGSDSCLMLFQQKVVFGSLPRIWEPSLEGDPSRRSFIMRWMLLLPNLRLSLIQFHGKKAFWMWLLVDFAAVLNSHTC